MHGNTFNWAFSTIQIRNSLGKISEGPNSVVKNIKISKIHTKFGILSNVESATRIAPTAMIKVADSAMWLKMTIQIKIDMA